MNDGKIILARVLTELPRYRYSFSNEADLHEGIAEVLDTAGISYQREFIAGPHSRFDFLCDGGVVLEAKVEGSFAEALTQAGKYCAIPSVTAVVIVSGLAWTGAQLKPDAEVNGKPLSLVRLAPKW